MALLREGLLNGRVLALGQHVASATRDELIRLGARVENVQNGLDDVAAEEWAAERSPLDALVYDVGAAFGAGGLDGLRGAVEEAWAVVRGVATGALIPADAHGKIVLVAPRPDAGPYAAAARAALENLARTLSVEWARYSITVTAIAPGPGTGDGELATLVAFLVSSGGDYLSGCRLELGAVAGRRSS